MATTNETLQVSIFACIFRDASMYAIIEDLLEPDDFSWKPFKFLYRTISEMVNNDIYPDVVTVATDLENRNLLENFSLPSGNYKGMDALNYLSKVEVNLENLESYAYQLKEIRASKQLKDLGENILKKIGDGIPPIKVLSDIDLETGRISVHIGANTRNTRTSKDVVLSNIQQFEKASKGESRYIQTGIKAWDKPAGGIAPRFYLIAAESNEGKSSLVLNIVRNVAIEPPVKRDDFKPTKVKLFTFESSAEEINNKLAQIETGISQIRIEKAELSEEELEKYKDALYKIGNSPILYDDSSEMTLPLLRTRIRKAVADGAQIIFIDQLEQIMIGGSGDLQQEHIRLNYITYRIKAYQREMDVAIILVHQLKKLEQKSQGQSQQSTIRDPQLNDLNQAGGKAPNAVLMLRTKFDPAFFWTKNREGEKGKFPIGWNGSRLLFYDLENSPKEQPEFVQGDFTEH